jgi:ribosomal-protein-alanine N-acetyltransferase
MTDVIEVRQMQLADIDTVTNIERDANSFPWSQKHFESCIKVGHTGWVFENTSHEIIAFAIVQQILDEMHLLNICVSPNHQGKGFGRHCLNHVIDFCQEKSANIILLEVRRSNERAQQLYLSAGFNEMSVRKGYYPAVHGREDAILMGMDLGLMSLFSQA